MKYIKRIQDLPEDRKEKIKTYIECHIPFADIAEKLKVSVSIVREIARG